MSTLSGIFTVIWVAQAVIQTGNDAWWISMVKMAPTSGALALGCYWLAMRLEKILERLIESIGDQKEAIERNTNSLMVAVLSMKNLDESFKPLAEKIRDDSQSEIKK